MADANNYLKNEILDHICNVGAWTAPTTLYLALLSSSSAASDDTTTNAAKEVKVGTFPVDGYQRQAITFGSAASGGTISNTVAVTFGPATADWDEVTDFWIVDSATYQAGNILYQGTLASPKTVLNTGSLVFAIGEIDLTAA